MPAKAMSAKKEEKSSSHTITFMRTPLGNEFSRAAEWGSNWFALAMFATVWQAGWMKKQGSDQAFHDRRYQERKRAEAARKPAQKKVDAEKTGSGGGEQGSARQGRASK